MAQEIDGVFAALVRDGCGALYIASDPVYQARRLTFWRWPCACPH
jgi:hypothetical protein